MSPYHPLSTENFTPQDLYSQNQLLFIYEAINNAF